MRCIKGVRIIIIFLNNNNNNNMTMMMIGKNANKPFEFELVCVCVCVRFCLSRSFHCRGPRHVSFGNYFTIDRTSLLRVKYVLQSAERYIIMNHMGI